MPAIEFNANRPCWFECESPDPEKVAEFYGQLFGWEYDELQMGPDSVYRFAKADGKVAAAIGPQPEFHRGMSGVWNLYISTDDADATSKKIADAGGKVLMEPFDVGENGRMGVYADPTGAHFATWEKKQTGGIEVAGEHGAFGWCEVNTSDYDAAAKFYSTVFGWDATELEESPSPYKLFNDGSKQVAGCLQMTAEWAGIAPHWMVYFCVDDCDNAVETVKANGGAVFVEPFDMPYGRMAVIADPTGAAVSIVKPSGLS